MSYRSIAALGAGALMMVASAGAQALPAGPDSAAANSAEAPLLERVGGGDGCGRFGIRGPRGFCRPLPGRGYGPRFYGPPRVYGPRFYGRPRYYRY